MSYDNFTTFNVKIENAVAWVTGFQNDINNQRNFEQAVIGIQEIK